MDKNFNLSRLVETITSQVKENAKKIYKISII